MSKNRNLLGIEKNEKTFINSNGYLEYKYPQGKGSNLVHRRVAFEEVYDEEIYPYDFEEYEVHHKNKDKLDNRPQNLELQLPKDHYKVHFGTYQEQLNRAKNRQIEEFTKHRTKEKKDYALRPKEKFRIKEDYKVIPVSDNLPIVKKTFFEKIKDFFKKLFSK